MKKIFITGGTSGIGLSLAENFLKRGWVVGVCGRDTSKIPKELKQNQHFYSFCADVTHLEQIQKSVSEFSLRNNGLDVVVANAGISVGAKDGSLNFALGRKVVEINVLGLINTFDAAMAHFKGRGHLVGVSSVAAFSGLPGAAPYSASKAAVFRYCEALSLDLKMQGIDVSCICPGFIDTPLTRKNNHKMPFIMSGEEGAQRISEAIIKKKPLYIFPKRMAFLMLLSEKMPRWLYRKIVLKLMGLVMPKRSKKGANS
jgi:short-subunit dehydrogenase